MSLVWSVGDESCGAERMVQDLPRLLEGFRGKKVDPYGHFKGCRMMDFVQIGGRLLDCSD